MERKTSNLISGLVCDLQVILGQEMSRILLVATYHVENGLATTSALSEILEHICPDVIFLEIPSDAFPDFDTGIRSTRESRAAKKCREKTGALLVPVDLPTPDDSFFRDWKYMDRRITATSPTFCQLIDKNTAYIAEHGFAYLNSLQCRDLWIEIYKSMEAAVQRLSHDTCLAVIYDTWRRTNSLRDQAMLQRMNEHFFDRPFWLGVLLVGAAHAHSIVSLSRASCSSDGPFIEWWNPINALSA